MAAEWIYERGIGEARAALVEDGTILEALVERDDDAALRLGTVVAGRLGQRRPEGGRADLILDDGTLLMLRPIPPGATEGARVTARITREAIPERGNPKPPHAAPAPDAEAGPGPDLLARISAGAMPVRQLHPHEPDRLEEAGWSELIEQTASGLIPFDGGLLRLSLTPAMSLFDVDGHLPAAELAIRGAAAAGAAIRRLGIGGSIGIDLPSAAGKAARTAAATALDAALPQPFERTAVNGFGFLQIVRRRERASPPELIQADPRTAAALALLRRAERSGGAGARTIVAAPAVVRLLAQRTDWTAELARRIGAPVGLREDARASISAGHVESAHP